MILKAFSLGVVVLALSSIPKSMDEEGAPHPYVSSATGGRFYFKMLPDPEEPLNLEKGSGTTYKVTPKEYDQELWSIEGWYAFSTYLSYDGEYLVRLGNWPRGHAPSQEHLAVAFYGQGKHLKSYSTKEIIQDASKVQPSISHYQYFRGKPDLSEPFGYIFELVTIDEIKYRFDIRNGEILSKQKTE